MIRAGRVLVVSDLHLGDGSGSDDFGDNDLSFWSWVDGFAPDVLVLNGDIMELWESSYESVQSAHKRFFLEMGSRNCFYVRGNHDLRGKLHCADSLVVITSQGKSVFIAHGHQGDPAMRNPLSRFAIWVFSLLEKIFPDVDSWIVSRMFKKGKTRIEEHSERFAVKMLASYDYVILGHTHRNGAFMNGRYVNSGTCQGGKFEGVLVDGDCISMVS